MSKPLTDAPDPAATDETTENARQGAAKLRDRDQPAAVVGLGASAGGIAVLQQFFTDMAPDSGLAFVVVMHLSPDHESSLAQILQQKTAMPVTQVNETVQVRPNHVYVIPPNKQLALEDGALRLLDAQHAPGRRVTIDLFFRTLAQAYGQRSVCIILSGTDSDGVIGLKHVRAQGGVTIAQDPKEAEHDSMPLTAISTGMVDWVLPVAEMAPKLSEFVQNERRMQLPPEILESETPDAKVLDAPGGETVSEETRGDEDEAALRAVLAALRRQTGHDFSHYKRATLLRRIARRMQVNSKESVPEYLKFFRVHPAEAKELLHDLLIGVTHFFRDRASFAALEANIPQLFAGKTRDDQIRVWTAGCATGEEAYSIAMLLCEHAERLDHPPSIQIFATDLDAQAISDARQGIYPVTIEADVSTERLRRFFEHDHGRYRVRKTLREKVLFAAHNLLNDTPFSNLDLVSCRNLLIYLTPKAQDIAFDIFHFALRAGGLLFIGGAENGSNVHALFAPVDVKHRLYQRRSVPRPSWRIPLVPTRAREHVLSLPVAPRQRQLPALSQQTLHASGGESREAALAGQERRAVLFGELHLKMLELYAPSSVVVNQAYDIVHLSEKAGRYLQFAPGEPTANLMKVVHPALQMELRTALFRAAQTQAPVDAAPVQLEIEGRAEVVVLRIRPVRAEDLEQGFFLILFAQPENATPLPASATDHDSVTRDLEAEIGLLKRQLNDVSEQSESANEELKASNEELQAVNEEMRSATEELETSKEELQSVNEELITVNNELKSSVEELSCANADLTNLMASTDIGTVFLDRQLRVQRFTPSAQKVFNLIPADVGRPISDITHKLAYDGLVADAEKVLDHLAAIEREVRLADEQWYLVRIAPYRTAEDRIGGVVATFIDITRRKRAEDELRASNEQVGAQLHKFNTVMAALPDFIYEFNLEGRFAYISQSLLDLWRLPLEQAIGRNFHELDYPPELATKLHQQIQQVIETRASLKDETPYTSALGARFYEYIFFPLLADDGTIKGVGGVTRDITDRKQAVEALRESEERFRQFAENSADTLWITNAQTRQLEYLSPAFETMWGEARDVIMRHPQRWNELTHPDDRERIKGTLDRLLRGQGATIEYRIVRPNDGAVRWIRDTGFPIRDEGGVITRVAGVAQDITAEREGVAELQATQERFRLLVEGARDYAMFVIGLDNLISYWSAGAERIFGWSSEEAVGQSGELIFTPEDRAAGREEKERAIALRDGSASDCRWHMRKDGSRLFVDGAMRRLDDDAGNLRGFAKVAQDATERWEADERLKQTQLDLERRVKERTAALTAANQQLQEEIDRRSNLEQEILQVSEREKRRIGQDLHDSLCQELAAAAFFLQSTAQRLGPRRPAEV
ncbi:MAG: PAS domain S-box protein, partial [Chthoniobacterales bacterium]